MWLIAVFFNSFWTTVELYGTEELDKSNFDCSDLLILFFTVGFEVFMRVFFFYIITKIYNNTRPNPFKSSKVNA